MFNFKLFREAQQEDPIRSDRSSPIYTEQQQKHAPVVLEIPEAEKISQPVPVSKRQYPQPSSKGLDKTDFTTVYNPLLQTYLIQFRGKSDEELIGILNNIMERYPAKKAGVYEWNIPNEIRAQYQAAYSIFYRLESKPSVSLTPEENIAQIQSRIYKAIEPQAHIISDMLRNHPNAESILYTAAQTQPRHLRGTGEIGMKVFFIINDIRNFIFNNINIDKTRKGPAVFGVFERFLESIAKELGFEFLPTVIRMFGNPRPIEVAKELRNLSKPGLTKEQMANAKIQALDKIRQQYVLAGVYDTNQLYSRLVQQYPDVMTPAIFTQLARPNKSATGVNILTIKRLKKLFDPYSETQNHGDKIAGNLITLIRKEIVGQYYSESALRGITRLWSIPVTDADGTVINDYMTELNPITKNDILDAAGFNYANYPTDFPEDELAPQEDDWANVDGVPQEDQINIAAYKVRVAKVLAECLETAESISPDDNLLRYTAYGVKRSDFRPGSAEEKIFYIWDTICKRDAVEFSELLTLGGYEYLTKNVMSSVGGRKQIDPVFVGFEFAGSTASDNERLVLDTLRNDYGLMANAFRMSLNSPSDCLVNSRGFVVDFMFPADVLLGWNKSEDGELHPQIATQMMFVGEAFGWDQDWDLKTENFKFDTGQVIQTPSGDMQMIKIDTPDGRKVIFRVQKTDSYGNPLLDPNTQEKMYEESIATAGSSYKIRTEWKKMYESFVATLLGGSAIFLSKRFTPQELQEQLDARSILWAYKGGKVVGSALLEVAEYVEKHPNSEASKYVRPSAIPTSSGGSFNTYVQKSFTPKQSYALSAMTQYRLQEGLLPIYARAESEGFSTKDISEYIKEINNIYENIRKIADARRTAVFALRKAHSSGDSSSVSREIQRIEYLSNLANANRETLSKMRNKYFSDINSAFNELEQGEFKASELLSRQHRYLSGLNRIQLLVEETLKEEMDLTENMSEVERTNAIRRRSELEHALYRIFQPMNLTRGINMSLFEQPVISKKTTASWYSTYNQRKSVVC